MVEILLFLASFLRIYNCAYCNGKPPPNAPANLQPIYDGIETLTFISKVSNGELYISGPNEQQLYVTHLYGTPYQMGYAQGQLLKQVITQFMDETFEYIINEIPGNKIVPWYANMSIQAALQAEIDATAPFTPDYWYITYTLYNSLSFLTILYIY